MAYTYKLFPIAQEDYESSVSWYLKRSLKAAKNFVNVVDESLTYICSDPLRQHTYYKHYYEFNIQKYPFTIVYTIEESLQKVLIVAIYHHKRTPENKYR